MTETELTTRLYLSFACGLGLIVWGLGNALLRNRRFGIRLVMGLAAALLSCGIIWQYQSALAVQVAIVAAGLLLGQCLLHVQFILVKLRQIAREAWQPQWRWVSLAVLGALVLAGGFVHYQQEFDEVASRPMIPPEDPTVFKANFTEVPLQAKTDRGRRIHVMRPNADELQEKELASVELRWLQQSAYWDKVIHLKGPTTTTNCHGWLFAEGRYIVPGSEVEGILTDHSYIVVDVPKIDDLVIYRDKKSGDVIHSSVVTGILKDGTILVEGKWGVLGVFLHPVMNSVYGKNFNYYRTPRSTHTIAGLDTLTQ